MTTRTIRTTAVDSPMGTITIGVADDAVVALEILDPGAPPPPLDDPSSHPLLAEAAEQLTGYLAGTWTDFDLPLDLGGTPFQRDVWAELARIPYGETISYAELAERVGRPRAFRAVGTANGHNPVAIIVPCHRVINTGGGLGGYGFGLDRKRWLLDLEQRPRRVP